MTPTDQSTVELWRTIVGTTYQESVLAYGNMHSNHGPADDDHLPEDREDARYAALTILSAAVGVPVPEISRLASEAAYRHGFYHDADYVDYLAEPDWDAVRDGTYTPRGTHRDPWPDDEPDEDDDEPDEDDDVAPDEYRLTITPVRRGRSPGYRVQVFADVDGAWKPLLDESRLPWRKVGPWRSTYDGARLLGLSEAYEIHATDGSDAPMVVYLDGEIVIDERAENQP